MSFDPTRAAPSVVRWAPCGPGGFAAPRTSEDRPPTTRLRFAFLLLAGALLQALPLKTTDVRPAEPPVVVVRAPEPEPAPPAPPRRLPPAVRAAAVVTAPAQAAEQPAAPPLEAPGDLGTLEDGDLADSGSHPHDAGPIAQIGL